MKPNVTEEQLVVRQALKKALAGALDAEQWGHAKDLVGTITSLDNGKALEAHQVLATCRALGLVTLATDAPEANGAPVAPAPDHAVVAKRINGHTPRKGRPAVPEATVRKMRRLRNAGVPAQAIAKKMGLSHFTVYKYTKA